MSDSQDQTNFVPTGIATKRLGVCGHTLRSWGRKGFIANYASDGGKLYWDVDGYIARRRAQMAARAAAKAAPVKSEEEGASP